MSKPLTPSEVIDLYQAKLISYAEARLFLGLDLDPVRVRQKIENIVAKIAAIRPLDCGPDSE